MRRSAKPPGARVGPVAAGAALVLLATTVGVVRYRSGRQRHAEDCKNVPTLGVRGTPAADAPLPPARPSRLESPKPVTRIAPMGIAAALLLGSVGTGFVGIAVASQRTAVEAPATLVESETFSGSGRDVEGWQPRSSTVPTTRPRSGGPTRRAAPAPVARVLSRSRPVSLHIPAIGVLSTVRHVGQAQDGTMETPRPGPYYDDAAWYRHSPTPGSLGPSILLGHVDSAASGPSVFFRLGALTAGDRVAVTRADDSVAVFRVDRVRRYAKDDFPTGLVYGDIAHAGLRLVTCGGAFDDASGHYLDNIVVFASLVDWQ